MADTDPIQRLNAALEGRYRVEGELGAGGMATVYLADDLKHERKVALKVLKWELAAAVGAERFLAEIKTTANLQHPNILPLHDSGEADGLLFYVMPFVEGESLRERLDREHQIPVTEAVGIATNLAEALDYAHRKGVIHRDIKPANVLLQDGKPVISDFGIALAVSAGGGGRLTETGLSLGTPHYMSPEQATGDLNMGPQADIYALGCVLYEMLAGEPPFTGSTPQAVLGRIIAGEVPSAREQRSSVPPNVDAVITKALEKVPADRFSTAAGVAESLADPNFRNTSSGRASASRPGISRALIATLAVFSILSFSAAVYWWKASAVEGTRRWHLALPERAPMAFVGEGTYGIGLPALDISPDGSRIVYVGEAGETTRLMLRATDTYETRELDGTEGAFAPFFSPDGSEIAFFADDQLKRVPADGGDVAVITEAPDAYGGDWSQRGGLIVSTRDSREIVVVEPNGLNRRRIAGAPGGGGVRWLPDGRHVLKRCNNVYLCVIDSQTERVEYLTADGPSIDGLGEGDAGFDARYLPNGYLLYGSPGQNAVLAVRMDPSTFATAGQPTQVLAGLRREGMHGSVHLAVADDGTLVYAEGSDAAVGELIWVDGMGREEPLPFEPAVYGAFVLSPDGSRIAAPVTTSGGAPQLRFFDLERESVRIWSGEYTPVVASLWAGDSRNVYVSSSDEQERLLRIDADDDGHEVLYIGSEILAVTDEAPDGRLLVNRLGESDVWLVESGALATAESIADVGTRLAELGLLASFPSFSPDGEWLAYSSGAGGRSEVYVVRYPFGQSTRPILLSREGGIEPVWSPAGDALYFRDGRRWYRVPRHESGPEPFGDPEFFAEGNFLDLPGLEYSVSPDGSRLLLVRSMGEPTTTVLNVVTDWFTELEAVSWDR